MELFFAHKCAPVPRKRAFKIPEDGFVQSLRSFIHTAAAPRSILSIAQAHTASSTFPDASTWATFVGVHALKNMGRWGWVTSKPGGSISNWNYTIEEAYGGSKFPEFQEVFTSHPSLPCAHMSALTTFRSSVIRVYSLHICDSCGFDWSHLSAQFEWMRIEHDNIERFDCGKLKHIRNANELDLKSVKPFIKWFDQIGTCDHRLSFEIVLRGWENLKKLRSVKQPNVSGKNNKYASCALACARPSGHTLLSTLWSRRPHCNLFPWFWTREFSFLFLVCRWVHW